MYALARDVLTVMVYQRTWSLGWLHTQGRLQQHHQQRQVVLQGPRRQMTSQTMCLFGSHVSTGFVERRQKIGSRPSLCHMYQRKSQGRLRSLLWMRRWRISCRFCLSRIILTLAVLVRLVMISSHVFACHIGRQAMAMMKSIQNQRRVGPGNGAGYMV